MPLLEINKVSSGYGEVQSLREGSLSLEKGRLTSLLGGNGSGKTTLLHTIMGLIRPWSGSIILNGEDISRTPAHAKPGQGLVLVPEGRQLFTAMSVRENLEMGASNARARPHVERNLERVFELFPRLKEREGQQSGTLSGGERQMLAVARGLMAEPEILMFDELSLGLAPVLVLELFETLRRLRAEGLTMLLVEQNVHMAQSVCDYAYVISEGRVTLEGEAAVIAKEEHVRKAYLGI